MVSFIPPSRGWPYIIQQFCQCMKENYKTIAKQIYRLWSNKNKDQQLKAI